MSTYSTSTTTTIIGVTRERGPSRAHPSGYPLTERTREIFYGRVA